MRDRLWLIIVFIATAIWVTLSPSETPAVPKEPLDSFEAHYSLNLLTRQEKSLEGTPVQLEEFSEHPRALLKLNFDEYREAIIRVHYGQDGSHGWSLNIGDSRSNNGYSGDAGTQTHDSELQVLDHVMSVWGSDVMVDKEGRKLQSAPHFVGANSVLEFRVSDQMVTWSNGRETGELQSPFLFALSGQAEMEGEPNRDIFIGLNRVVWGGRVGSGVERVEIAFR